MYDMGPLVRTLFIAYGAQEENNHRRLCLGAGIRPRINES